jgi:FKBP-type peptidyl-prolyl cis-trans isomerase FkpA
MTPRHRLVFPVLGLLFGCSGGSAPRRILQSVRAAFTPQAPVPDTIPEMLDYSSDLQVNLADMARLPEGVLWRELSPGDSARGVAMSGDSVEVTYLGWLPSGLLVDSGFAAVRVGSGSLLAGIDLGIPGMQPGGRRKLVIPPGLGYGAEGIGEIPPLAVLVYDLELVRIIR